MVREISDIVNVNVSIQTPIQSREGFGTPLITFGQTADVAANDRVKTFTKPSDMLDDVFNTTDTAYKMAVDMYSQSLSPQQFKVGTYKQYVDDVWTVVWDAPATGGTFDLTVDGQTTASPVDWDATALEIQAAIEALSTVTRVVVTGVSANGFTLNFKRETHTTITADVSSLTGVTSATETKTQTGVAGESWATIITAFENADPAWYEIECDSQLDLDILDIASDIETRSKQFGALTVDNVVDSDTGHVAASLKAQGYLRTFTYYSSVADNYVQSALAGRVLPADPGSINWNHKTLSSVSSETLTATQSTNAATNNVNYLVTLGGNITSQGGQKSAGGTVYRDLIRGMDYLVSKIEEAVFNLLNTQDKVPFTNAGIAAVEAVLRGVLETVGVGNDIILPDYTVTVPDRADISAIDRAARFLDGITFVANLQGAVNTVRIVGTLTQ